MEVIHYFEQKPSASQTATVPNGYKADLSKSSVEQTLDLIQAALDGRLPDPQPALETNRSLAWTSLLLLSSGLAVTAVLIYLAFCGVGWILAGFAND
jgi:hypothetical protein